MREFIFRPLVRTVAAVSLAAAFYVFAPGFIAPESRLLVAWNAGVGTVLLILAAMMIRSDARQTSMRSQREEPSELASVAAVLLSSLAAFIGTASMLDNTKAMTATQTKVHLSLSVSTVLSAWFLVHTYFALYYAQLYYDETSDVAKPFQKGLQFPDGDYADYWDFMYYSFTIGMCYQTSDVTITSKLMRRVSLGHAVVSFLFVAGILGMMVNIMSSLLPNA